MSLTPNQIEYQMSHVGDNRAPDIIASSVIMLVAAYATIALRFTSRRLTGAGLKSDDWMILIGAVRIPCTAFSISQDL